MDCPRCPYIALRKGRSAYCLMRTPPPLHKPNSMFGRPGFPLPVPFLSFGFGVVFASLLGVVSFWAVCPRPTGAVPVFPSFFRLAFRFAVSSFSFGRPVVSLGIPGIPGILGRRAARLHCVPWPERPLARRVAFPAPGQVSGPRSLDPAMLAPRDPKGDELRDPRGPPEPCDPFRFADEGIPTRFRTQLSWRGPEGDSLGGPDVPELRGARCSRASFF